MSCLKRGDCQVIRGRTDLKFDTSAGEDCCLLWPLGLAGLAQLAQRILNGQKGLVTLNLGRCKGTAIIEHERARHSCVRKLKVKRAVPIFKASWQEV